MGLVTLYIQSWWIKVLRTQKSNLLKNKGFSTILTYTKNNLKLSSLKIENQRKRFQFDTFINSLTQPATAYMSNIE